VGQPYTSADRADYQSREASGSVPARKRYYAVIPIFVAPASAADLRASPSGLQRL